MAPVALSQPRSFLAATSRRRGPLRARSLRLLGRRSRLIRAGLGLRQTGRNHFTAVEKYKRSLMPESGDLAKYVLSAPAQHGPGGRVGGVLPAEFTAPAQSDLRGLASGARCACAELPAGVLPAAFAALALALGLLRRIMLVGPTAPALRLRRPVAARVRPRGQPVPHDAWTVFQGSV